MPMSTHTLLIFLALVLPLRASVLINEVHINPPGGDDEGHQYVEVISLNDETKAPEAQVLGNLTLLFLDSNGGSVGEVRESLSLQGLETGTNGILLIGIGFDTAVPWTIPSETKTADFAKLKGANGSGDIGPKGGLSVLLVEGFTGSNGQDLDGVDDGDLGQEPWTRIRDSIGYGDAPYETRLFLDVVPDNLSRSADNTTQNTTRAWYGGALLDTEGLLSLSFEEPFGPFTGTATPGAPNQGPPAENPIRINEVLVNPGGEDGNNEFIELISTTGGITSTAGLWLLVLDSQSDGGVVGEVLEAWDLSGQTTGTNGLLVVGDDYTRSMNPWKDIISKDSAIFDPAGMGAGDIGGNDGFTLLLVSGFTGKARDSLGNGDDVDTNDDGMIDAFPWDTSGGENGILDSVGFSELSPLDNSIVQQTLAPADVTPQVADGFHPDSVVRDPGDMTANAGTAWQGGNVGGNSGTGVAYNPDRFFGAFRSQVTPGLPNLAEASPQSLILINEVHLDPVADPDLNFEYVELLSPTRTYTPLQNLSLLLVDVSGVSKGIVRNVLDLRGLTTGSNGLLLLGDSYSETSPYGAPMRTHLEDPPGLDFNDIGPNGNFAMLLVDGFTSAEGVDLDENDDGMFDVAPWTAVMDAVGFGEELLQTENIANLNEVGFTPDTLSRIPSAHTPNSVAAWSGARLEGEANTSLAYGEFFGPFQGQATPGQANAAAPILEASLLINEVHINPPGDDDNYEFIEILSTSGGRQSTHDHTLVLVENAGDGGGDILEFWNLDGMATGSNGLLLLGNGYSPGTLAYWDRSLFPDLVPEVPHSAALNGQVTAVGDPLDLGNENLGPNNSFVLLLVKKFRGEVGQDLDEDNDGVFDAQALPWAVDSGTNGILDAISILDYSSATMTFDGLAYVEAMLGQETYVPDTVARRVGQHQPIDLAAWFGGSLAGDQPTGLAYGTEFFGQQASATPGLPNGNTDDPNADDDHDGESNGAEAIAGTDPLDPADYLRVTALTRDGATPVLTWTSVTGKAYHVEYSVSLEGAWETISTSPVAAADGNLTTFMDDDAERAGRTVGFYRVRVSQ